MRIRRQRFVRPQHTTPAHTSHDSLLAAAAAEDCMQCVLVASEDLVLISTEKQHLDDTNSESVAIRFAASPMQRTFAVIKGLYTLP